MKDPVKMLVDMSGVDELIGTAFALDTIGRQSKYMQDLITAATVSSENTFNMEVAAFAGSTGKLGHMFEWGTVGINTSPSNMSLDPMDDSARLWETIIDPGRAYTKIDFDFRPSVAVVPKPPAEKTQIPERTLSKLRDHIFWNKARVLEMGIAVTIAPKSDNIRGLLFVPNVWNNGEPGYTMFSRPTRPNISKDTKGTFTIYFINWWEKRGAEEIQAKVEKYFNEDFQSAIKTIRSNQGVHDPKLKVDKGIIQRKVRSVRSHFEKAAAARVRSVRK